VAPGSEAITVIVSIRTVQTKWIGQHREQRSE
jgi:hypothetical protein